MSQTTAAKQALRKTMRQLRDDLPLGQRERWSAQAAQHLCSSELWQRARTVGLFMSFGSEIETGELILDAKERGIQVALPAVVGRGRPLEFRSGVAKLVPGPFGILTPEDGAPVIPAEDLDLVVLPGLAFDGAGYRLGYGGGFYDRTVGGCRRWMLAFSVQEVSSVPHEGHDLFLDGVITEAGLRPLSPPPGPADG